MLRQPLLDLQLPRQPAEVPVVLAEDLVVPVALAVEALAAETMTTTRAPSFKALASLVTTKL